MSDGMVNGGNGNSSVDDDLKRKLILRVAFAGLLIAALLGALAFIDYLGTPPEEPVASGPTFTAPVPVPKKEVSQPVKPAEPAPASSEASKPVAAAPVAPPVAETPAKPEVAAQPSLPVQETKPSAAAKPAARAVATPAEGTTSVTSQQFFPPAEKVTPAAKPAAEVPSTPVAAAQPSQSPPPPAPPRLFSGFAVQAGVFADAQRAEELRAKLTLNGIPSTMEARVQVGPFKTREEAEAARQKMKALGIDGVLLPPRK